MLRNVLSVLMFTFMGTSFIFAQGGSLKVKLFDKANKEPIPFANVVVESKGAQVAVGTTNMDGEVMIKPITPGTYDVKATYVGYQTIQQTDVIIPEGKTTYLEFGMSSGQVDLSAVEIIQYKEPLIDPDTKSGGTVTREEYINMPSKNINSVAATTAGVFQERDGTLNIRGARSNATEYYIDGQKVIGSFQVPQRGVEQVTSITGGIPASYGDVTGGVIAITTQGAPSRLGGGVEILTSEFLDGYGHNFLAFSIGAPLLMKTDAATGMKRSVIGFHISGEGAHDRDPDPSAIGMYKVNDDKLAELENTPLSPRANGVGLQRNAELIRMSDLEKVKYKPNDNQMLARLTAKIDIHPTSNLQLTLGGGYNYSNRRDFTYTYALFNPVNNPNVISDTYRGYAKITQKFGGAKDEKSTSNIRNSFYTFQVSYEKQGLTLQDPDHKENFFDYGYIGRFEQVQEPTYAKTSTNTDPLIPDTFKLTGWADKVVLFTPSDKNPTATKYTQSYYNLAGANNIKTKNQVLQNLALLNGSQPLPVYSLWQNTGFQNNRYEKRDDRQFRVAASFSTDIKNHALQIGFEYEQRIESRYILAPVGLWGMMRQQANFHLSNPDTLNPGYRTGTDGNVYIDYKRKSNPATQYYFDKKLREALYMGANDPTWLDIDSYEPSMYKLNMFSAEDMLERGIVNYWGYDYTGEKLKGNYTIDDFFTKKDANNNFSRLNGAYQPIYTAGFIQDKFDFRDMKFLVGLRVDRFDANQSVLRDRYLLYPAKTKGEVSSIDGKTVTHPSNIGNDYTVYVNDAEKPTRILGYRSENKWYNSQGIEIADPNDLAVATSTGQITPYLVNSRDAVENKITTASFKDYEPQITVMPRIAFSFPISDMANFFAHYDILTQRPQDANRLDPISLRFLATNQGSRINNPDLKPERTTDYELGFSQVLTERKNSAITLSAFYREMKDQIQVISVYKAHPVDYQTYGNIDFGTVKGFTAAFDLRRTSHVQLTASYTLQFADGTGSNANEQGALLSFSTGVPNLRTTFPLDFDQRHRIVANVDYRFGSGKDYKGPSIKGVRILEKAGANAVFNLGSGLPYSKQFNVTQNASFGVQQRSVMEGSINGSSRPWRHTIDLRIDKGFDIRFGKAEDENKRITTLNLYLQVFNVLNTQNIDGVYRYTGNPDDDGFLTDAAAQSSIISQLDPVSFRELYALKVNNPGNYSPPRRMRLGIMFDF